jgi:hypothetical protein
MKQEEMFTLVESWVNSGKTKAEFLKTSGISFSKFNYWIKRYRQNKQQDSKPKESNFQEIHLSEQNPVDAKKILEVTTPVFGGKLAIPSVSLVNTIIFIIFGCCNT